ncbi:hypothetical protein, partial [Escherichia coli]|uniref:hypothetical protein n=2 Tax=Escherichia coli TaxID=562 RepID=UPI001BDBB1E0
REVACLFCSVYGGEICSHRSPFFHDPTVLYLILICSGVLFRRSQCLPPCSVIFIAKMKIHVLDMGNAE